MSSQQPTNKVLIIDDEDRLRSLMGRIIKSEGFEVLEAADCKSGLKRLEQNDIDVVLCDVKLPDGNGVELVTRIKAAYPETEVILLTAYGNIPDGVQAIKNGAFDYITKGDDNHKIVPLLYNAAEKVRLQKRVNKLEALVGAKYSFHTVIGKSRALQEAITLAQKVAPTDTTVLLCGETGTGKEIFAQAIHQASQYANYSFVALNCSSFGKEILESELFGYKQGAFTGAMKDKKGLLEEANGGTLFLDEIGEMPLEAQTKLLRVLETNEFIKVGETKTTKVKVRLIAATNKDLKKESGEGRFRNDLFFRLSAFPIELPPLRERYGDIPLLAEHYVKRFCASTNKPLLKLSKDYLDKLDAYQWPGNVRELKNVLERSVLLAEGPELTTDTLPYEILRSNTAPTTGGFSAFELAGVEKLHIQKVLNYTKGNKTEAARLLNIGLTTLYRKLEEYKIS